MKASRFPNWIYAILLLSFSSCHHTIQTAEELEKFIMDESHGLSKTIESKTSKTKVVVRSTDMLVYQHIGEQATDANHIESLRHKYDQYQYFILSLSHNDKEALHQVSRPEYGDMVRDLSFHLDDHINITTQNGDTLKLTNFILDRTYNISRSTDMLLVFNKIESNQEWIQLNVGELGLQTGNQHFRFLLDDLRGIPQINFSLQNKN